MSEPDAPLPPETGTLELAEPAPAEAAPSESPTESPTESNVVSASFAAEVITSHANAYALLDEWRALFVECRARNPFANPTWLLAWAEYFVPDGDLFIVALRDRGRLCCVAPFYRRRIGKGAARFARSLQLMGAVEHVVLTERPQILARPSHARRAMRQTLEVLQADTGWDWVELSMASDQGWFEPAWINAASPARPFVVHKTSRPSVGLDLPTDLETLRSGLKRNLRESLRRARNRLNRTSAEWDIEVVTTPSDFALAIDALMGLHRARASMPGTVEHADMFADPVDRTFVFDALMRMAHEGSAEALFVRVGRRRVAGLMTLLTPDAVYFCFSGVDPEWWSFSAVTLLQWEAMSRAVAAGRTHADLSVGVDVAKLRWSESVDVHPEFFVVARRPRSELAFGAYFLAATAARGPRARSLPANFDAGFDPRIGMNRPGAIGVEESVPSAAPLRVAMVCNGYRPHIGGVETHVGHLVDALARLGVRVEVLTQETDRSLPAVDDDAGVVVRRFRSIVPSQRDAQAPGLWSWIRRHATDHDVVHFHSYHALVSGASMLSRAPVVFTPHYHGTGHSPARAALHHVYRPFGRRLFARAAAVICVSEAEAAIVNGDFASEVGDRVHVIPNGVDVDEMRRAEPMEMPAPYFLALGRLERYKRLDRVIDAMTRVPEPARLVVVGSGPARSGLVDLVRTRALDDRVLFLEDLPRPEVLRWLAGAQAIVSMSEHEAFGLTLAEGLAAGRRVVASDLPAHREVSRFGRPDAVRLVPASSDVTQLADAMRDCLGSTRDLDRGARVPSWDDVAARTVAVYRGVTGADVIAALGAGFQVKPMTVTAIGGATCPR